MFGLGIQEMVILAIIVGAIIFFIQKKRRANDIATSIETHRADLAPSTRAISSQEPTPQCNVCDARVVLSGFSAHLASHKTEQKAPAISKRDVGAHSLQTKELRQSHETRPTTAEKGPLARDGNARKPISSVHVEDVWFVLPHGKKKEGPFTLEQLRARLKGVSARSELRIRKETTGGWCAWVNVGKVFPELAAVGFVQASVSLESTTSSEEPLTKGDEQLRGQDRQLTASAGIQVQKIPCNQCGAMILPRTAEKTGGFCMPCSNKLFSKSNDPMDDPNKVWTCCENCGCAIGVDRATAEQIEGKLGTCHCSHESRLFFVDRIIQFHPTAPNPCAANDPRRHRPFQVSA